MFNLSIPNQISGNCILRQRCNQSQIRKAKASILEDKAWTLKSKARTQYFVLLYPRDQGLSTRTTSLSFAHCTKLMVDASMAGGQISSTRDSLGCGHLDQGSTVDCWPTFQIATNEHWSFRPKTSKSKLPFNSAEGQTFPNCHQIE